jgi:hypothetical protein
MKTIQIVTALLFSVILGMIISSVTGFHPLVVIPFIFATIYFASKYAPKGVFGMDLMSIDESVVDNMAGVQRTIYIGLHQDVDVWPTVPAVTTAMDTVQGLTGALTMKYGKYFFPFEIEPDKCSVECSDVGVKGGISQKYTVKLYRADMSLKMRGFLRATNNQKLVMIVPDNQGRHNFIGSQAQPLCKVPEGTAGTGEGPEGESAAMFTFVSYGNGGVPLLADNIVIPIPADS